MAPSVRRKRKQTFLLSPSEFIGPSDRWLKYSTTATLQQTNHTRKIYHASPPSQYRGKQVHTGNHLKKTGEQKMKGGNRMEVK